MKDQITIVGLGPGGPELLTREAWDIIRNSDEIYFRTGRHPVVSQLPTSVAQHTFDHYYEELEEYEAIYQAIAAELIALSERPSGVVYAVPGDPGFGEATVQLLRHHSRDAQVNLRIVPGISFVEVSLEALGVDALDGLSICDAHELALLHHPPFPPDIPTLVGQMNSRGLAGEVKLVLLSQYPPDHDVVVVNDAGTSEILLETLPLAEMDHTEKFGSQTTLYLPPLEDSSSFEAFQETVAHLRAPDGCPWDREQTHSSLRRHLLLETYESLSALDQEDLPALREELGDLLLQIILQAQIAYEEGAFTMAEVVAGIQSKIIRRHPHVFEGLDLDGVDQVLHNWEALKEAERVADGEGKGLLGGVPIGLPALAEASEIQARVARVGFDWPDIGPVLEKLHEELEEVRDAEDEKERAAEIGDLLFAVVNYARWLKLDPESELRDANHRFRERFGILESMARSENRKLSDMSLVEMDDLWNAAKGKQGDQNLG